MYLHLIVGRPGCIHHNSHTGFHPDGYVILSLSPLLQYNTLMIDTFYEELVITHPMS